MLSPSDFYYWQVYRIHGIPKEKHRHPTTSAAHLSLVLHRERSPASPWLRDRRHPDNFTGRDMPLLTPRHSCHGCGYSDILLHYHSNTCCGWLALLQPVIETAPLGLLRTGRVIVLAPMSLSSPLCLEEWSCEANFFDLPFWQSCRAINLSPWLLLLNLLLKHASFSPSARSLPSLR